MSIGERITNLRKDQNLSQGQIATMLGITRQAVSKWENDLTSPDTIKLIQLADVLNTDVEYLATGNHCTHRAEPDVVVKTVDRIVEKVVEKPVILEKTVEVEKIVETIVEKPILKKVVRIRYLRNPVEYLILGAICFLSGLLIGFLL